MNTFYIGKYKIFKNKFLGKGSYANVYLAEDVLSEQKVAVKILNKTFTKKERVLKEFNLMKKLHHKNIIEVFDFLENDVDFFIFMMYIPTTLRKFEVKYRPLTENFVLAITSQIVDAVEYLHSNGIAQLDIKLANILIDDNLNIYITDFGLSEEVLLEYNKDVIVKAYKGTVSYAAPEAFAVRRTKIPYSGFKADVWSIGICMYFLLHGHLPYVGDRDSMERVIESQPLKITRDNIRYSTKVILRNMLEKDPNKRMGIYEIKDLIDNSHIFDSTTLRHYLNYEYNILYPKDTVEECIKTTKKSMGIKDTITLIKFLIPNKFYFSN